MDGNGVVGQTVHYTIGQRRFRKSNRRGALGTRLEDYFRRSVLTIERSFIVIPPVMCAHSHLDSEPGFYLRQGDISMSSHSGEKIFISYSHKDTPYLEVLKELLAPKIRDGTICFWDDNLLKPGNKWREKIEEELSSATIALLLVSDHYLASAFIAGKEFRPILDRAKNDGLRVAWMLLRPCLWKELKIKEHHALHDTQKPLSELMPKKRKEEWIKICEKIVEMVKPPDSSSLIKGWYPYKYEDKAMFADLQRQDFIETCASGICHEDFRFGLLQGESGVGKTSLLQAGLRSRLEELGYDYKYIDLRSDPPPLLQELTPQRSKPLVLLLDHFEKAPIQPQDDFYQALYLGTVTPPVR